MVNKYKNFSKKTDKQLLTLKHLCLRKINRINKVKDFDSRYGVKRFTDPKEDSLVKFRDRLFLIDKELLKRVNSHLSNKENNDI